MESIYTEKAPKPAGNYEQGWKHGNLVFVSGQLPIDPETGMKCHGTITEQTIRSLKNVQAVLEAAGTDLEHVLKVTVYISDISLWDEMNEAYGTIFNKHKPARSVVPTRDLHFGMKVEIEAIASV